MAFSLDVDILLDQQKNELPNALSTSACRIAGFSLAISSTGPIKCQVLLCLTIYYGPAHGSVDDISCDLQSWSVPVLMRHAVYAMVIRQGRPRPHQKVTSFTSQYLSSPYSHGQDCYSLSRTSWWRIRSSRSYLNKTTSCRSWI